ncbi:MAG: alpha/beta hydrolase [Caulobacteraceae bacterium]
MAQIQLSDAGRGVFLLGLAGLGGCGTTYTQHPGYPQRCETLQRELSAAVDCVTVFYGTNRAMVAGVDPFDIPTDRITDQVVTHVANEPVASDDRLNLGRADVWLPRYTSPGEIRRRGEEPRAREETPPEQERQYYVYVTRIAADGESRFVAELGSELTAGFGANGDADPRQRSVLLFVHGFNVSFDEALIKAAQLSFDLQYPNQNVAVRQPPRFSPGAPVLFAWPSLGETSVEAYHADERQAAIADERLREFLNLLLSNEGLDIERVNIVAHSMGNRVLTDTLREYALEYQENLRARGIEFRMIVAAADVDRDDFENAADEFRRYEPHVTIYTSNNDFAMFLSRTIANAARAVGFNQRAPTRLGDSNDNSPYVGDPETFTTIDTTNVASMLEGFGHGYYANNRAVLNDARCALAGIDENERALMETTSVEGEVYYRTRPLNERTRDTSCTLATPTRSTQRQADEAAPPVVTPPPPAPAPPPPVACPTAEFVVYYEWDRANLNQAALDTIDAAVTRARQCNVSEVVVVGHTDSSGSTAYNQGLSERRAGVVRDALVARGISALAIRTESRGETDLARPTRDGVREPLNRRAAVTFRFR